MGEPSGTATAGFGGSNLFELDEDEEIYTTARHRLLFFGRQEFEAEKPEKTFRIFALGGSTVHGRPYENGSAFLKWMGIELGGRDSTRDYETVNCGGLSYASYRLVTMLKEVLQYDPDLIVVATGHNEFLEDRSYESEKNRSALLRWAGQAGDHLRVVTALRQLLKESPEESDESDDGSGLEPEVEARLDDQSGYASYHRDDAWRQDVIDQYADSVREMIDLCREASVPLILVNLGDNLRDCPPFKSEHGAGLSAEAFQLWQELYDQGAAFDAVSPSEALAAYKQAETIDDQYALLAFRMARCFDRIGDMKKAAAYYRKARQLDICPLRMVDELHEHLLRIAAETKTPLVDAEALAAANSPDGIPGNNCFMDHVHPDIDSHQQIGRLLADEVEAMGLVEPNGSWSDAQRRRAYRNQFRRLGPVYLANGRRRVGWLENWARRARLDQEGKPVDARGHLHLGKKRLDYGEVDSAWEQMSLAIEAEPKCLEEVLDIAFEFFCQGRPKPAQEILVRLHRLPCAETYRPAIELAYTITALDAGQDDQAEAVAARYGNSLREATTDPNLGRWLTALAPLHDRFEQLLATSSGSTVGAPGDDPFLDPAAESPSAKESPATAEEADPRPKVAELLDKAILRNPESAPLYLSRARMRFAKKEYAAALEDLNRSIELAPDNSEAFKFRAILQMLRDNSQAAVDDLSAAIALDPNDPELFRTRAAAYRRLGEEAKADADLQAAEDLAPEKPML